MLAMVVLGTALWPIGAPLGAQEGAPPDSSAMARARAEVDSAAARRARDTIKAPLPAFPAPRSTEVAARWRFDRQELLGGGVHNLADLLDRIPGVTSFRTGWLAGVHAAAFHGDFRRVRVFVDGLELDAVDPRGGGTLDLVELPLWTLDEVVVERAAGEVRVWATSWRSDRVTPYTRVDIFTGDLNTNAFRGLFARRFRNGAALQVGAQQLAMQRGGGGAFGGTTGGTQGSGEQQVLNLRLGWAGRWLSADAYGTATTRVRDPQAARDESPTLPGYRGARREGYARIALGDTGDGLWAQALAGILGNRFEGVAERAQPRDTTLSPDTLAYRQQRVVAVGWRRAGLEAMLLDRMRLMDGRTMHAPAARAALTRGGAAAIAHLERVGLDSALRSDVSARIPVLPWLVVSGAHSAVRPDSATGRGSTETWRAEGGVRLWGRWLTGGYVQQGRTAIAAPVLLGAANQVVSTAAARGLLASASGPLYKDLRADVHVLRWNTAQYARPRTHLRAELALVTGWLSRFPKGEFGFDTRLLYELRDPVPFFYGSEGGAPVVRLTERTQTLHASVEIRIQQARIFYQYRNLTGGDYEQVPRILMPPIVQLYGVRWEFWN